MTRLVGVRAVCDACGSAPAVTFCVEHRNVTCVECDAALHNTQEAPNDKARDQSHASRYGHCSERKGQTSASGASASPSRRKHNRVDLACTVTALPFCDYCDKAPATIYCESEGNTLCDRCDGTLHNNDPSKAYHGRRLISRALAQRTVSFNGPPPRSRTQKRRVQSEKSLMRREGGALTTTTPNTSSSTTSPLGTIKEEPQQHQLQLMFQQQQQQQKHNSQWPSIVDAPLTPSHIATYLPRTFAGESQSQCSSLPQSPSHSLSSPNSSSAHHVSASMFPALEELPITERSALAVVANAAAQAGEMFLLNAGGTATQPTSRIYSNTSPSPDPAGLATAATAAAESVAAAMGASATDLSSTPMGASLPPGARCEQGESMDTTVVNNGGLSIEGDSTHASSMHSSGMLRGLSSALDDVMNTELEGCTALRPNPGAIISAKECAEIANEVSADDDILSVGQGSSNDDTFLHPTVTQGDLIPVDVSKDNLPFGNLDISKDDFGTFETLDLGQFDHDQTSDLFNLPQNPNASFDDPDSAL